MWLIGAGPDDPELLTLKAAGAVAAAGLASPAIVVIGDVVRLASAEARAVRAPRAA